MVNWDDPYYVTIETAVRLSAHRRGHVYLLARAGDISSTNIDSHGHIYTTVFSLRDLLIYERDRNRRGQQSVVEILESLSPLVYSSGENSESASATSRGRGALGRLRNKKDSMYTQDES